MKAKILLFAVLVTACSCAGSRHIAYKNHKAKKVFITKQDARIYALSFVAGFAIGSHLTH
jgi:hypothetical protein